MSNLTSFLDQAWEEHGDSAAAVAERLPQALALVRDDDGVTRLAALSHHVLGEHLCQWSQGLQLLQQLADLGLHQAAGGAALARCQASLRLCAGQGDDRPQLSAGDRSRVSAMAAANLGASQAGRALAYLQEAEADAAGLSDADVAVRALAVNANNLAVTLQALKPLPAAQRELMLHSARLARRQWQRAGGWLGDCRAWGRARVEAKNGLRLGAKHSHAWRHGAHSQRRISPFLASTRRAGAIFGAIQRCCVFRRT